MVLAQREIYYWNRILHQTTYNPPRNNFMFNDADENAFIREKRDLNQISEIRLIVKDVYSHNNHSKM